MCNNRYLLHHNLLGFRTLFTKNRNVGYWKVWHSKEKSAYLKNYHGFTKSEDIADKTKIAFTLCRFTLYIDIFNLNIQTRQRTNSLLAANDKSEENKREATFAHYRPLGHQVWDFLKSEILSVSLTFYHNQLRPFQSIGNPRQSRGVRVLSVLSWIHNVHSGFTAWHLGVWKSTHQTPWHRSIKF